MICYSPNFTGILADSRCALTSGRRKKRAANFYGNALDFFIGFELDGHNTFNNITEVPWLEQYGQMSVQPNPDIFIFTEGDEVRRLSSSAELVEVKGSDLLAGKITKSPH